MKFDTQKRKKYLGPAQVSIDAARAVSLWCWYYNTTEEFDGVVNENCAEGRTLSAWERSLCARFAHHQMNIIEREAHIFHVGMLAMEWGKQKALSMTPKARVDWLEEVGGEPTPRLDF